MDTFKIFLNVLSLSAVVCLLFLQSDTLAVPIILLLFWLSLVLLSISFPKQQGTFLLLQLLTALAMPFVQPLLFYLLPNALGCCVEYRINGYTLSGSLAILLLYGAYLPSHYLQLAAIFWSILILGFFIFIEKLEKEYHGLNVSSELLRVERNRLSTLFSQSVMNSEAREKEAALSERQRLVHQIHDELGHKLTGGLIQMEAAKAVYQKNPKQAADLLDQAIATTRNGIDDIRHLLHTQAPATESLNLNRIKKELQHFSERYQIAASFQYFGKVDQLDPSQWQVLLGNLKESLTNTLKYANASEVTVRLHVYKGFLRFQISNNGRPAKVYHKGLGIIGMEERTAMLDGQLLIDSTDGFTVTTILPISQT